MRRYHSLFVRLASAAVLASSVAACNGVGEEFQRGYVVDERAIAQVKKGMSAEQVLQTLGTPSTVSTVGNRTGIISASGPAARFQFMGEQVVDQQVTAVYFDPSLQVERVALYGLQDGKVFDFISRTTPAGGEESSFLGQIFKGMTSFNPFS